MKFRLLETKMNFLIRQVLETLINRQAKRAILCKNGKGEIDEKLSI